MEKERGGNEGAILRGVWDSPQKSIESHIKMTVRLMHIMKLHTTTASSINTILATHNYQQIQRNTHVRTHICVCVRSCMYNTYTGHIRTGETRGCTRARGCERDTSTYAPASNANRQLNQLHRQKRRSRAFRLIS